ncbi:MAG TPA: hypothetical protein VNT79_00640 [Phycisphaerae bacterium]|nr:hypothetical protein [Phycisphaerae bacterium]
MKPRRRSWLLTTKRWAPLALGGMALQFNLGGCDPAVRDAVLGGLQTSFTGLLSAVINAFFLSLADAGSTSQPVVQVITDVAQSIFA